MVKIETIEKFEGKYITVDYSDGQVTGTLTEIDTDTIPNEITVDWETGFQVIPICDIQGISIEKNPMK